MSTRRTDDDAPTSTDSASVGAPITGDQKGDDRRGAAPPGGRGGTAHAPASVPYTSGTMTRCRCSPIGSASSTTLPWYLPPKPLAMIAVCLVALRRGSYSRRTTSESGASRT
jgi:hypothetical protein